MKKIDWIKLTCVNLLFILFIISPFLPGPPNKIVIGLSVFAQSMGFFGLLLIPIGLFWSILELRKRTKQNNENPNWQLGYSRTIIVLAIVIAITGIAVFKLKAAFLGPLFAIVGIGWAIVEIKNLKYRQANWKPAFNISIIALIIVSAIYLLLLIGVFISAGILYTIAALIPGLLGFISAIKGIKKLRANSTRGLNLMPFYLLTIPLIALLARIYLMEPVSSFSRSVAIKMCGVLIAAIDNFRTNEGQYPETLQQLEGRYLNKIPSSSIMGILNLRYYKINEYYSISFSQWLQIGSLEQIVLYDQNNLRNNGNANFAKYDYNLDPFRVRRAFASFDTGHENWRYYQMD